MDFNVKMDPLGGETMSLFLSVSRFFKYILDDLLPLAAKSFNESEKEQLFDSCEELMVSLRSLRKASLFTPAAHPGEMIRKPNPQPAAEKVPKHLHEEYPNNLTIPGTPNQGGCAWGNLMEFLLKQLKSYPNYKPKGYYCGLCNSATVNDQQWVSHCGHENHIERSRYFNETMVSTCNICGITLLSEKPDIRNIFDSVNHHTIDKYVISLTQQQRSVMKPDEFSSNSTGTYKKVTPPGVPGSFLKTHTQSAKYRTDEFKKPAVDGSFYKLRNQVSEEKELHQIDSDSFFTQLVNNITVTPESLRNYIISYCCVCKFGSFYPSEWIAHVTSSYHLSHKIEIEGEMKICSVCNMQLFGTQSQVESVLKSKRHILIDEKLILIKPSLKFSAHGFSVRSPNKSSPPLNKQINSVPFETKKQKENFAKQRLNSSNSLDGSEVGSRSSSVRSYNPKETPSTQHKSVEPSQGKPPTLHQNFIKLNRELKAESVNVKYYCCFCSVGLGSPNSYEKHKITMHHLSQLRNKYSVVKYCFSCSFEVIGTDVTADHYIAYHNTIVHSNVPNPNTARVVSVHELPRSVLIEEINEKKQKKKKKKKNKAGQSETNATSDSVNPPPESDSTDTCIREDIVTENPTTASTANEEVLPDSHAQDTVPQPSDRDPVSWFNDILAKKKNRQFSGLCFICFEEFAEEFKWLHHVIECHKNEDDTTESQCFHCNCCFFGSKQFIGESVLASEAHKIADGRLAPKQ